MLRDMPRFLLSQYQALGPIFRVRALHHRFTVLAGPEANLFMTRGGAKSLTSSRAFGRMAEELRSPNLLVALDGPRHTTMRRMLRPAYSREAAERNLPSLFAACESVAREHAPGESVPIRALMQRLVTEQVGLAAVGHGGGAEVCRFGAEFSSTMTGASLGRWPAFYLWRSGYRHAKAYMEALAGRLIEARRASPRSGAEGADLADIFIHGRDPDGKPFEDGDLIYGVLGAFVAGMDTAASVASFLLWELLRQPELLAEVVAEVDEAFDEGVPTAQGLRGMRRLRAAYLETMRLHPINIALPRHAAEPFEFAGHRVEAGEALLIGATVSHFLPHLFPDPYRFDVDRYGGPRHEDKQPGAFAPYGLGHHVCLGAGQAEIVVMLAVSGLLRTWRLELDPPGYVVRGELSPLPAVESACRVRTLEARTPTPAATTRRRAHVAEVLPTLDHALVAQVAERVRTETHDPGAEIIVQGAVADRFHIIVEGEVEVWVREGESDRRTGRLSSGDYFGEIGLLTDSPRNATVRALGPVATLSLGGDDFRAMLEASDLTSQEIARVMRARIVAQDLTRVFPSLDAALAARMPGDVNRRRLAGGEDIVRQGEPAESFYVLVSGTCDVLGRGPGGALFPLAELGPGEFFGEVGLMLGVPRTATVRARTDVELLELSRDAFNALAGDGRFAHEEIARVMRRRTQA
jgi:cytochrome P450/CRP-like cAMP-binding protein